MILNFTPKLNIQFTSNVPLSNHIENEAKNHLFWIITMTAIIRETPDRFEKLKKSNPALLGGYSIENWYKIYSICRTRWKVRTNKPKTENKKKQSNPALLSRFLTETDYRPVISEKDQTLTKLTTDNFAKFAAMTSTEPEPEYVNERLIPKRSSTTPGRRKSRKNCSKKTVLTKNEPASTENRFHHETMNQARSRCERTNFLF